MNLSIIKLISHPHAIETMQSRRENAHITGQEIVENAYWFENTETGQATSTQKDTTVSIKVNADGDEVASDTDPATIKLGWYEHTAINEG